LSAKNAVVDIGTILVMDDFRAQGYSMVSVVSTAILVMTTCSPFFGYLIAGTGSELKSFRPL
jgi:hypothetical protein